MFEPLQDLLRESLDTVVRDAQVLGENGAVLYGSSSLESYTESGGAVYQRQRFANRDVAGCVSREKNYLDTYSREERTPLSLSWHGGLSLSSPLLCELYYALLTFLRYCLAVVAFWLPAIRTVVPTALWSQPSYVAQPPYVELVRALAFHPDRMLLAIATDEGAVRKSSRVSVYNVADSHLLCVLAHAFMTHVETLAWKPYAKDVLAVGCRGGVLMWSLNACEAAEPLSVTHDMMVGHGTRGTHASLSSQASALFYRCANGLDMTCLSFSCLTARYMACGSRYSTKLYVLNVSKSPVDPFSTVCSVAPSIDGGTRKVAFADDDTFVISCVCNHSSLAMMRLGRNEFSTVVVATPAPVMDFDKATGVGFNYFFLFTEGLEGVLVAHINPFVGVEIVATISTGLYRGIGGTVRTIACSKRRLFIALDTGHLLVCRYGYRDQTFTLIPVGVAAMDVTHMVSFDGFTHGSLFAVVERGEMVSFIPCYHC